MFGTSLEWNVNFDSVIQCSKWYFLSVILYSRFIIEDVREEDLEKMSMQLVVCDASKIPGKHRPLGQIKIAPNMAYDNYHWEEMMKNPGELVKMTHPLQQIWINSTWKICREKQNHEPQ